MKIKPSLQALFGRKFGHLKGYCQMRHDIELIEGDYLEFRLRRYLTFAGLNPNSLHILGLD